MRGALPVGSARRRGPLYVALFVLGMVLVWILFLPPFSVLRGGDSTPAPGEPATTDIPPLPEGLEAISALYQLTVPDEYAGANSVLTVKLDRAVDKTTTVNLYTYADGGYKKVATAELDEEGRTATGAVESTPDNVIALRRVEFKHVVGGWLPLDEAIDLDPEAAKRLTWVFPLLWKPDIEGSLRPLGPVRPLDGAFRVAPTVRASDPESIDNVAVILADQTARDEHIQQLAFGVETYDGLNLDYRGVSEANTDEFARFIASLAEELHSANKTLFVTLPFPDVDDADIVDHAAYDWKNISLAADYIVMMPDRDQAKYVDHMVAGMRQAIEKESIDPLKILLVLSPYSAEKSADGTALKTLGQAIASAAHLEVKGQSEINTRIEGTIQAPGVSTDLGATPLAWSDECRCVSFTWPDTGGTRTMWIENRFSAAFKLLLLQEFGLGGLVVEDVAQNEFGADLWPAILPFLEDGKPTLLKPNPDVLQMTEASWESTAGTLSGGSSGVVTWLAPSKAGKYTISLTLSDGVLRMGTVFEVRVQARPGETDSTDPTETPTGEPTEAPTETPTPTPGN